MKTQRRRKHSRNFRFPLGLAVALVFAAAGSALLLKTFAIEEQIVGEWQVLCDVHHLNPDDPIVLPNQPGKSHMHSFLGNHSTNASTTTESLMANRSSCGRNMETTDRSAYWVPSIYIKKADGSMVLAPTKEQFAFIYYERLGGPGGQKVLPFPNGLRMIAGNPTATSAQPKSVLVWTCGGGGPETSYIPYCPVSGQIPHVTLFFPNCWNGRDLDSPDHKSHMAYYTTPGKCPPSHPVSLPRLKIEMDHFDIKGGPDHILASGGQYSYHGDFFSAWDVRAQNALVSECLNTPRHCIGIERQGDKIIKPSYDPDPIPDIILSNFSSVPQTTGTLPNPAPPPAAAPAPKPAAKSPATASPNTPVTTETAQAAAATQHAFSAEHGSSVNAKYDPAKAAEQISADKKARRYRSAGIIAMAAGIILAAVYVVKYRLRRG